MIKTSYLEFLSLPKQLGTESKLHDWAICLCLYPPSMFWCQWPPTTLKLPCEKSHQTVGLYVFVIGIFLGHSTLHSEMNQTIKVQKR